jgi:dienelactone hydrolase
MLGNQAWMARYVGALIRLGHPVYVPHYFDRTSTLVVADMDVMKRDFLKWLRAVEGAIVFARRDARLGRVGLIGLSLGGFLATAIATRDPHVAGVVEMCGGAPPGLPLQFSHAPPFLVMHGGRDPVVPVALAYRLIADLSVHGVHVESRIYERQGHGFNGVDAADAERRALRFLERELHP